MYRSPLRGPFLSVALGVSLFGAAAPAVAAPSAGELVSRADGVAGESYGFADLQAASADGRFVVFLGSTAEAPANRTLLLRDRTEHTTVPVVLDATFDPSSWTALDVSDDGSQVLLGFWDGTTRQHAVADVETGTIEKLGATADGGQLPSVSFARFLDGGAAVLYSGATADGKLLTYKQTADAAPQLAASGVQVTGATRSGNVLVWSRPLLAAARPAGNHGTPAQRWPAQRAGIAVGYTVAGGAPKVVARTAVTERTNAPGEYCAEAGVDASVKTPALAIDDYGHRLELTSSTFDERYPNPPKTAVRIRYDLAEDGSRELWGTRSFGYPFDIWGGATGTDTSPALPELKGYPDAWAFDARFFAHDTGILREETVEPLTGSPRVIYAYAPVAAGSEPAVRTPAPLEGEQTDSATLTPEVTWGECDGPAQPLRLSAFSAYATIQLQKPVSSRAAAGTVSLTRAPVGGRPASRTLLQVKTLGFVTWSRTVDWTREPQGAVNVQLPRPWLFLPQTLTVKVSADKGFPTTSSPAESVQKSLSWTATR